MVPGKLKEGLESSIISSARANFHTGLLAGPLTQREGIPSIADKSSATSVRLAREVVDRIGNRPERAKLAGQVSGSEFEKACRDFLSLTFLKLGHLRPGSWAILPDGEHSQAIETHEQFAHLLELESLARENPRIRALLGNDYTIKPDILISRWPEPDSAIDAPFKILGPGLSRHASIRSEVNCLPVIHASISCKWTLRSDRAQNARTEALNLIRNRKGRVPHIVVVTAEPMPGRLASLALGTGDIDCVYHFALYELLEAVAAVGSEDSAELLSAMVEGKRLKDISDLPLDLVV